MLLNHQLIFIQAHSLGAVTRNTQELSTYTVLGCLHANAELTVD